MADTNGTTRDMPTAGDIWLQLVSEEKNYQSNEEVEDRRRRKEYIDNKIDDILLRRRGSPLGQERE